MSNSGTVSLKDFIKETLNQIDQARSEEESFVGVRGVVDFDVSVVAEQKGKAGFKVGVVGLGGELGGQLSTQTSSRIKFSAQTKGAISPSHSYTQGRVGGVSRKSLKG